jgi:hypothetical protein
MNILLFLNSETDIRDMEMHKKIINMLRGQTPLLEERGIKYYSSVRYYFMLWDYGFAIYDVVYRVKLCVDIFGNTSVSYAEGNGFSCFEESNSIPLLIDFTTYRDVFPPNNMAQFLTIPTRLWDAN